MEEARLKLQARYKIGHTIPGTRSFHVFLPVQSGVISFKRTAEGDEVSGKHHFFPTVPHLSHLSFKPKLQDYVAARYDGHWWVGLVVEINQTNKELFVKSMTPHGPKTSFHWPVRDNLCWVPTNDVIRVLQPLSSASGSGRSYVLEAEDAKALDRL